MKGILPLPTTLLLPPLAAFAQAKPESATFKLRRHSTKSPQKTTPPARFLINDLTEQVITLRSAG
jgi:hypothetical protein